MISIFMFQIPNERNQKVRIHCTKGARHCTKFNWGSKEIVIGQLLAFIFYSMSFPFWCNHYSVVSIS